jgi:hypothetical protein
MDKHTLLYGLLAQFDDEHALVAAARRAVAEGYAQVEAYTPYPVEDLPEALNLPRSRIPVLMFVGGALGALTAYGMQYYASVVSYPLNVAGRPLHSWPSFIPVTFELTVLFAALFGAIGMLALNGLPRPHHPLFYAASFARASQDGFFLAIEATDPKFDRQATHDFLAGLAPRDIVEVPDEP